MKGFIMSQILKLRYQRRTAVIILMTFLVYSFCFGQNLKRNNLDRLQRSVANPHLLETINGTPVFLNNYTLWRLIETAKREEVAELFAHLKNHKYNAVSTVILTFKELGKQPNEKLGTSPNGSRAFETDSLGTPDPLRPITTPGNRPDNADEYDFWDNVEYIADVAAANKMYVFLHPAWGEWFSGYVHGQRPGDTPIFNGTTAYKYGNWLAKRFKGKTNIIWMLGGDRSAIYNSKTKWYEATDSKDYRHLYRAMAEGIADGSNGIENQDGQADYSTVMISYHPRKWAPNSSEWFHDDPWLSFNSIQDTPTDQIISFPHDYNLTPPKPTWLYEPIYEETIHTWGVRYQAYQTVFMGGFGHTYGSDIWEFKSNWRALSQLPGVLQMAHLYKVSREIWSEQEYLNRIPDQDLIMGDKGKTYGRGISAVTDFETKENQNNESSNRITAMRGRNGQWAMVYSANGREVTLDLSRLKNGKMNASWFNPRTGNWWVNEKELKKPTPFHKRITTGKGTKHFNPPGSPGADNDWVLVLR